MARALTVLVLLTAVARADVISEEEDQCRRKSVGNACAAGVCVAETCSRARPGPDGKPVTTSWQCVMCRAGAPDASVVPMVVGIVVAVAMIGGGVVLARKRMKATP
jgi:hypothetical protein